MCGFGTGALLRGLKALLTRHTGCSGPSRTRLAGRESSPKPPASSRGAGADHSAERPAPTLEQVQALTAAMPEGYRVAVVFAAWGTLRSSEILALQRQDIDLTAGTVNVTKRPSG